MRQDGDSNPATQDMNLVPYPQGYRHHERPGALLELVIHASIDLDRKGGGARGTRDWTGSGMKIKRTDGESSPGHISHDPNVLTTRPSLSLALTFLELVFIPALIARYGKAGPSRHVTGLGS